MAASLDCLSCGLSLDVSSCKPGKRIRCKTCGVVQRLMYDEDDSLCLAEVVDPSESAATGVLEVGALAGEELEEAVEPVPILSRREREQRAQVESPPAHATTPVKAPARSSSRRRRRGAEDDSEPAKRPGLVLAAAILDFLLAGLCFLAFLIFLLASQVTSPDIGDVGSIAGLIVLSGLEFVVLVLLGIGLLRGVSFARTLQLVASALDVLIRVAGLFAASAAGQVSIQIVGILLVAAPALCLLPQDAAAWFRQSRDGGSTRGRARGRHARDGRSSRN